MPDQQKPAYGGQAVIEGVMFGGKNTTVTAIRRKDESIEFFEVPRKKNPAVAKLKKIPFLRGIGAILDATAIGTKHLNFSSDRYDVDPKDDDQIDTSPPKLALILGVAVAGVLSFLFAQFVFVGVPAWAAHLLSPIFPGHLMQNVIEDVFKIVLLLGYIYFISMTPLMKRVFQYHGAEHKVINTFENGDALTVDNVKKHSRLHYRCGSSFILFTAIVGIILYYFLPTDPLWQRLFYRIILIPVVLGISFETLQLTSKLRDVPVLRYLGYPGLWLQLLTTKEPDRDQVEVAIRSFNEMLHREENFQSAESDTKIG
ncbi:MAG TPA: DUF1385 domain-containing protein [Bacillales bacterium]|nr:DUF1385 domain-containing protein [Bacillales bacterium]